MIPTRRKPTSPGKILLEEFLIPLNISQIEFVEHLGGSWTQPKLSAIINGKRAITEEIALDFADALGTSPEFWIGFQSDLSLWEAAQRHRKIKRIPIRRPRVRRVRVSKLRTRRRLALR